METETYKNAKMILERFDPESKKKTVSFLLISCRCIKKTTLNSVFDSFIVRLKEFDSTPVGPQMTPKPGQGNQVFFF